MTDLITGDVWGALGKAARSSRRPALVAVAYWGQGAVALLPLAAGSRVVVDASEGAVRSGQTCPAELLKLVRRGVRVYSVPNLHAKVYVIGNRAFIGSANVSRRSSGTLVEAMLSTGDARAVAAARQFVRSQCKQELGPELLRRLQRSYRPPRPPGTLIRRRRKVASAGQLGLPDVWLVQLSAEVWPRDVVSADEAAWQAAQRRRKHPRGWSIDGFRWTGRRSFKVGDLLVMVTKEANEQVLVSPPGNVLFTKRISTSLGRSELVYVEVPDTRRRSLGSLAKRLGRGAKASLLKQGLARNARFARELLAAFGNGPGR